LEAWGAEERARDLAVISQDLTVPARGGIVVPAIVQRGVVYGVKLVGLAGERLEGYVDEHGQAAGVGNVGLGDPVLAVPIRVDLTILQRPLVDELHALGRGIRLTFGERVTVAHDELQVAHAWRPEIRVIHLGQLRIVERVPYLAGRSRRGPEPVLVGRSPDRRFARGPRVPLRKRPVAPTTSRTANSIAAATAA
jgi:hypothetical protein